MEHPTTQTRRPDTYFILVTVKRRINIYGSPWGVAVRYRQIQLQKIAGKIAEPPPPSWRVKVICGAIIIHTVSVRWSVGYAMNNLDGVPCIHPSLGIQIYIPLL